MSLTLRPVSIGPVKLNGPLFLAPMAGYTDRAFRSVALEHGADLAFTEMVSCEALWRGAAEKTLVLMERAEGEKNLALQLFSGNMTALENSLAKVLAFKPEIIDLNCGCPVAKVTKSGAGSALMGRPELMVEMIAFLKSGAPGAAVTVKFRLGGDAGHINFLDVAERVLAAGADMITLHPRTAKQAYAGRADWSALTLLKRTFPKAVVCGSGDLFTALDVARMFEETGVDAVMVARGSVGNPFIFEDVRSLVAGESPSMHNRIGVALLHFKRAVAIFGEEYGLKEMKKHVLAYGKGSPFAASFRTACVGATSALELETLLHEFSKMNGIPLSS